MTYKKQHGSKEHFGEIDYIALEENMGDESATSWLLSKMGEEGCNEIKTRIEKALIIDGKNYD